MCNNRVNPQFFLPFSFNFYSFIILISVNFWKQWCKYWKNLPTERAVFGDKSNFHIKINLIGAILFLFSYSITSIFMYPSGLNITLLGFLHSFRKVSNLQRPVCISYIFTLFSLHKFLGPIYLNCYFRNENTLILIKMNIIFSTNLINI